IDNSSVLDAPGTAIYVEPPEGQQGDVPTVSLNNDTAASPGTDGIDVITQGPGESSSPVPTVKDNTVSSAGQIAIDVYGTALNPSLLTGNSGSGNKIEQLQLGGTVVKDLALPLGPLPAGIGSERYFCSGLQIAHGATMSVAAGTVLKNAANGCGAGLQVE